jgi:omega-6 fatty acid desaturase (delta-12 desaturase)
VLKLGACGIRELKPGEKPEIAKQKDTLPTKKELQAVIPSHCFERSSLRSLGLVLRDGFVIAAIGCLGWQLPTNNPGVVGYALWNLYWFAMGTALTGWWVLAHECGHRGFSANNLVNDSVGFVLHSILLVPYFSWQYSHAKHHAKCNHMLDGETHVPPSTKWRKLHAKFHAIVGDEAFVIYQLVGHLLFGWPAYLFFGITGSRRTLEGKRRKSVPDHWRPGSEMFPARGNWTLRVAASTLGVVLAIVCLYVLGQSFGHTKISMLYWPAYLWVNCWLVLYTWLQHTDKDIPHFGEDEWTWVRGALCTIDRPYGVFDWMHHHIGSTHVCHHLFSSIPCYHAQEATAALKSYLVPKGLYNYDGQPWWRAAWNVSRTCHYMPTVTGICTGRSLNQDLTDKCC